MDEAEGYGGPFQAQSMAQKYELPDCMELPLVHTHTTPHQKGRHLGKVSYPLTVSKTQPSPMERGH